jgi:hypothetical protein
MDSFEIERPSGRCAVTGRELQEGETYYAVVFEEGEGFRRADYSAEAWSGPPAGAFCTFKSRVPVKARKKRLLIDDELLVQFFQRLDGVSEASRIQLRFVLALILMRKRLIRYEDTRHDDDGGETWHMRLAKEGTVHRVVNPRLSDEQIESVSRQLGVILSDDAGTFDDDATPVSAASEG